VSLKLDGTRAAGRTINLKRANLSYALNYAVELGLLDTNPIRQVKWKTSRTVRAVDRRSVANPDQARCLLHAVSVTPRSGPRLMAFFACLYYSALRPEEAANLRKDWLDLPADGWGWITLETAAPEVERHWSDEDQYRVERPLKHRAKGETRRVPCPPELTKILRDHLARYGTDDEGRLFRGLEGRPLSSVTYLRIWDRARQQALTPRQYDSPLARRPYDLRHAAVSTWLNGGVGPAQVAEWAGHSIAVLHRTYAKCIDGQEEVALRRIEEALGPVKEPPPREESE
jgi:integrase